MTYISWFSVFFLISPTQFDGSQVTVGRGRPGGQDERRGMLIVRDGLSDQMCQFKTFENKVKYIYGNVSIWKNQHVYTQNF